QLLVILQGSAPPIWRRLQLASASTLPRVHRILQVGMGWEDSHPHRFLVGERAYSVPDPDGAWDVQRNGKDERRVRLRQIAPHAGATFVYEYDFGARWKHLLLAEQLLPRAPGVSYPRCLAGQRACPPEDCGGRAGYEHLQGVLRNRKHPEYEELRTWAGVAFDPDACSGEAINAALQRLR